jgi:hypothetical protein
VESSHPRFGTAARCCAEITLYLHGRSSELLEQLAARKSEEAKVRLESLLGIEGCGADSFRCVQAGRMKRATLPSLGVRSGRAVTAGHRKDPINALLLLLPIFMPPKTLRLRQSTA